MFSLDNKQWESVAAGLLSSVTKPALEQAEQKPTDQDAESEATIDAVAIPSNER